MIEKCYFTARQPRRMPCLKWAPPAGYTLVELLVSIAVITLLIGLLSVALQQSWAASRRVQCQNNLRNINLAMLQVVDSTGRFPASGNFTLEFGRHHSWVVDILPWIERTDIADRWNKDRSIYDATNLPLTKIHIPILVCPDDISLSGPDDRRGDLSYVVNGGVGFTVFHQGVHDCPIDLIGQRLDLNGDGSACPSDGSEDEDKALFLKMGLFFNETWNSAVTRRHHTLATVTDGLSHTVILSENARSGFNPADDDPWATSWASPSPMLTSFHIGNPCMSGNCSNGNVDYARSNQGDVAINAGLKKPEGASAVPNSFHPGGVHFAFGDGRVHLVSQSIDGAVYAALVSPQGGELAGTSLRQLAGEDF